ncbi:uncharacterized protein mrt [Eurosta solidaginis]|uniref:uncharacterized protein mrt n=1 Tax=Eurosta solidaginis TaxID=178769 RepID=UPI0035317049
MLMPRIPYHLTNGYSPEMSIALNMQHQQQHINQLLNTAATGTGIVGDVDALLTPIQNSNNPAPARTEVGRERNLWRTNEIMEVLKIMQEINAIEMLSVKTVKSELIFRKVERIMFSRGFRKKSHVQIWTKWKFLKSTYSTSRRNGIIPKMIPQLIYDEIRKMLQNANNTSSSGRSASNCGNSATSLDGDSSNLDLANNNGGSLNDSELIISGVEGGYDGSKSSLEGGGGVGDESDEETGLAHPIFGFRLGLVKQEPSDTGYEPAATVKKKDTTDHIQFQTEIKKEVTDACDSPVASTSTTPQPPVEDESHNKRQSAPEIMILSRRVAPPTSADPTSTNKSPTTGTSNATSTPNGVISSRSSSANTTPVPSQLPPLRIAPFAKVSPNEVTTTTSAANLPPPPPLAMNPTSSALRLNSAYSSNAYAMADKRNAAMNARNSSTPPTMLNYQRRLISNHLQKPQASQSVTVSTRLPPVLDPSYMRHQEVVVPDLDATPAPPEYQSSQPFYGFPDGPSTSQQAQQQLLDIRKRRLGTSSSIPPKRILRPPEQQFANRLTPRQAALEFGGGEDFEEGYQNGIVEDHGMPRSYSYTSTSTTQRPPTTEPTTSNRAARDRDQITSKVLQDVALSLRQMQREVVNEFFKRQMKLAREEHEFQKQQDELLMQAFKDQAMQFQQMSKQLMGSAVKIEKRKKRLEKQARKQMLNNEIKQVRKMQTQFEEKKAAKNMKVKPNGIGNNLNLEQTNEIDEDDNEEDGIQFIMRNVRAQLDLSEDDDDGTGGSKDPHQYEYAISEYTSQGYRDGDMEQHDAIDTQESMPNDATEEQSDEGSEDASDGMEIIGH